MNKYVFASLATSSLAFIGIRLAGPTGAAPSGPPSVEQTIAELQSDGSKVIVNKVGSAPLSRCTVKAVRPGQTVVRRDSGAPGAGSGIVTTVVSKTVYLDLTC
jgi:hypothetical protein